MPAKTPLPAFIQPSLGFLCGNGSSKMIDHIPEFCLRVIGLTKFKQRSPDSIMGVSHLIILRVCAQ
jgi:hypothetical protein